jgi:hypothetical protein
MDLTLKQFAAHLARLAVALPRRHAAALDVGARIIKAEAKHEIGRYQGRAGPFAAWAPLAEATVADRTKKGFTPNDPLHRTGSLRQSIEHKVVGNTAHIGSDDVRARLLEMGDNRVPPRSYLGGAAVRKGEEAALAVAAVVLAPLVRPGVTRV